MRLPPLPRSVLGWIIPAIVGLSVWYAQAYVIWQEGFDSGAAVMQCVDYVAILGNDEAKASAPCVDARERGERIQSRLFMRRSPR